MKKTIIGISIVLISILLFPINVKAESVYYSVLYGDIYEEENVIIAQENNDEHTFSMGKFIFGCIDIEYSVSNNSMYENAVEWIYYSDSAIYEYGFDIDDDPLEDYKSSIYYRIIVLDSSGNLLFYGYIDSNNSQYYYNVNNRINVRYVINSNTLESFISNNPRNYNSSETIVNNNTITSSVNVDYDYFFSNLSTNFGINQYGSCGFVAIASLLTYYDFFFNDDFISDSSTYYNSYCSNHNFIKYVTNNGFSTNSFYNSPGYNDSLQYFLIDEIAIDNLNMSFEIDNDDNPVYGTSNGDRIDIIENYIENVATTILSTDYSVNTLSTEAAIKNEIDLGRPVIIGSGYYEYEDSQGLHIGANRHHAFVIYGYKELSNGETIYRCHMGWRHVNIASTTHDILLRNDDTNIRGLSLVYTGSTNNCNDNVYLYNHGNGNCFGLCHKHSGYEYYLDKVIINSSYDYYYCPTCNGYIMNAPHIHEESYSWRNLNNHLTTCPCGLFSYQAHVIDGPVQPNGYYICVDCGGYARIGITPFDEQEVE